MVTLFYCSTWRGCRKCIERINEANAVTSFPAALRQCANVSPFMLLARLTCPGHAQVHTSLHIYAASAAKIVASEFRTQSPTSDTKLAVRGQYRARYTNAKTCMTSNACTVLWTLCTVLWTLHKREAATLLHTPCLPLALPPLPMQALYSMAIWRLRLISFSFFGMLRCRVPSLNAACVPIITLSTMRPSTMGKDLKSNLGF